MSANNETTKIIKEGQPNGGENFGKNNITQAGNDDNNPAQNAGEDNAYFNRKQPAEEHTESNNFKPLDQEGSPDYAKAQTGKSDNDPKRDPSKQTYEEGTADDD
ncbi:hypothetical protein FO440_23095 [Mucilaginibacter corticis]|uniref:Uncharacterized protein n=1 Tax=Mucilaginibacter corticis TaxID=2597670 RepID=A0A556M919_9SPHI|nr:hypothetical protein [Mucilaginibacter corticis]TSJ36390.1 hypothetical protein FO440_23095 [Mucilaginibacter corticis]